MIQIARAKPEDAGMLTDIAFRAKRHWGYPERWMENWRELLTVRPEFVGAHETYAAILDGRLVGFYALEPKDSRLELSHLWVLPEAMGRGIGRLLFFHAVERAKALGARTFAIESDPNAETFYLKMGARRAGSNIRKFDEHPRELPVLIYQIDGVT